MRGKKLLYFIPMLLGILIIAKLIVTGINHMKICDAIYVYRMECVEDHRERMVHYDEMESYGKTFLRWWDWGHKRILDDVDYFLIQPYIGQMDSAEFAGQYFEG